MVKPEGAEVFHAETYVVVIDDVSVEALIDACTRSPNGRARFCAHANSDAAVHEMFIVLAADTYVRPHRHLGKSESFHVIRGRGRVLLFDEDGSINRVICLAEPGRGEAFYYRLAEPRFHTVLVDESPFVIHETTTGPFRAGDAEQAAWAPAPDDDSAKIREYVQGLRRAAAGGLQP